MDESFEDLLFKYKQIQLELECIRKAETMALEPAASPVPDDPTDAAAVETRLGPEPDLVSEEQLEKDTKVFQAFNIKPLRQKLPTPAELDELHRKWAGPDTGGGADGESGCRPRSSGLRYLWIGLDRSALCVFRFRTRKFGGCSARRRRRCRGGADDGVLQRRDRPRREAKRRLLRQRVVRLQRGVDRLT